MSLASRIAGNRPLCQMQPLLRLAPMSPSRFCMQCRAICPTHVGFPALPQFHACHLRPSGRKSSEQRRREAQQSPNAMTLRLLPVRPPLLPLLLRPMPHQSQSLTHQRLFHPLQWRPLGGSALGAPSWSDTRTATAAASPMPNAVGCERNILKKPTQTMILQPLRQQSRKRVSTTEPAWLAAMPQE